MKIQFTIIFLALFQLTCFSQETFTSRKGPKIFPGHWDIVVTLDSNNLTYELFNHWYSQSYAEYRQITIPLNQLKKFNESNDSIKIELLRNKVKLVDKKYRLNRKIKHRNLCASVPKMRKISFAYKVSKENGNLGHFALFKWEDLQLSEEEFKSKVIENLKAIKNNEPLTAP